jgi:hypothetical protein
MSGRKYLQHCRNKRSSKNIIHLHIKIIALHAFTDQYVKYFTSPYFIFARDTISYLVLLGLHFAICLQPSTIHFTFTEWAIMFFFLGRLLMEVDQAMSSGDEKNNGKSYRTDQTQNRKVKKWQINAKRVWTGIKDHFFKMMTQYLR